MTIMTDDCLRQIEKDVQACVRCKLSQSRTNVVVGEGNPVGGILFIGEAPGQNEDEQGLPFVGRAGHLLDQLLAYKGLSRGQVYIVNMLKCRPPQNRVPSPEEIAQCFEYLERQIRVIKPKVIVTLGKTATSRLAMQWTEMGTLLKATDLSYTLDGISIPIIAMYHPSYLLRTAMGQSDRARALIQETLDRIQQAKDVVG